MINLRFKIHVKLKTHSLQLYIKKGINIKTFKAILLKVFSVENIFVTRISLLLTPSNVKLCCLFFFSILLYVKHDSHTQRTRSFNCVTSVARISIVWLLFNVFYK